MDLWIEFAQQMGLTVGVGAVVFVLALVAISHLENWRQRRFMRNHQRRNK